MKKFSLVKYILPLCYLFVFQPFTSFAAESGETPVRAELKAEEESIQPGRPFWVGVELKMAEGWDTYWMNPGDSGFPTQVNWQLPEGFTAGPLEWPYPETITTDSLVAFGYTDSVLLLSQITPPKNLPAGEPVVLEADVNWLACKDSCVPGSAHLSLSLPVSDAIPKADKQVASLFAQTRQALPQQIEEGNLTILSKADEIVMFFKPQPGSLGEVIEMQFIPHEGQIIDYAAPQPFQIEKEGITLNVKKAAPGSELESVKGVLLVSEKGNSIKRAIHVNTQTSSTTVTHHEGVSSVGIALLFAFLGGLILNVMPCVLPVIALKIFGFVKMAHQKRGVILQHGAVFSLGVLISFWVLSGALLILRAYGEGIGWGFQLQEPVFVAILAGILFLLGLSLFGLFEVGTSMISLGSKAAPSQGSSPLKSSFMSGVLATLVATPCTGPLLGPALGFAMTLPPVSALMIFTMMGIGMAFPYLLFSAFPKLVRFLPKPGNWMITFKQLMGFLMMATVVWLVWVFGAQTDNMATFVLLTGLLVLAIGGWIFGRWGAPTRRRLTRTVAIALSALLFFVGGGAVIMTAKQHRDFSTPTEGGTHLVAEHGWEVYNPERVAELRAQGVPVFVDFTAKWCLICQANKAILHSANLTQAFKDKGVVTMIADWTKKDPVITEQLEKLGRTGVPVYVLYPGDLQGKPLILPQTLSAKVVTDYLGKLGPLKTTVYVD